MDEDEVEALMQTIEQTRKRGKNVFEQAVALLETREPIPPSDLLYAATLLREAAEDIASRLDARARAVDLGLRGS